MPSTSASKMLEHLCLRWKGKTDPFIPHLLRALMAHLTIRLLASPGHALVLSSLCKNAWYRNEYIINYAFLVMLSVLFVMVVTKAKQSGKCQLPPGFHSENLTNSVLSLGQAVGRELCPAAAAGQRAAAWTDSTVSKLELHGSRALFSHEIFMSSCFSLACCRQYYTMLKSGQGGIKWQIFSSIFAHRSA